MRRRAGLRSGLAHGGGRAEFAKRRRLAFAVVLHAIHQQRCGSFQPARRVVAPDYEPHLLLKQANPERKARYPRLRVAQHVARLRVQRDGTQKALEVGITQVPNREE